MATFTQTIQQKLAQFTPFLQQRLTLSHHCFKLTQGQVADFVKEMMDTCAEIEKQTQQESLLFYSQRLVEQFDCLNNAIGKLNQQEKAYISSYHFPANIHTLPKEKRVIEYQKALRALNEKISWLIEKSYQCSDEQKVFYINLIQETEYRRQKCLHAIEQL